MHNKQVQNYDFFLSQAGFLRRNTGSFRKKGHLPNPKLTSLCGIP